MRYRSPVENTIWNLSSTRAVVRIVTIKTRRSHRVQRVTKRPLQSVQNKADAKRSFPKAIPTVSQTIPCGTRASSAIRVCERAREFSHQCLLRCGHGNWRQLSTKTRPATAHRRGPAGTRRDSRCPPALIRRPEHHVDSSSADPGTRTGQWGEPLGPADVVGTRSRDRPCLPGVFG